MMLNGGGLQWWSAYKEHICDNKAYLRVSKLELIIFVDEQTNKLCFKYFE